MTKKEGCPQLTNLDLKLFFFWSAKSGAFVGMWPCINKLMKMTARKHTINAFHVSLNPIYFVAFVKVP